MAYFGYSVQVLPSETFLNVMVTGKQFTTGLIGGPRLE